MKEYAVVYEDDEVIVIDKPAGLAVQGGERVAVSVDDMLERRLSRRPFLVHRLDKDTSGLLLVAKTKEAAARFSQLFSGRELSKTYLALCAGAPAPASGTISDPVRAKGRTQEAVTRYRVRASAAGFSLLELELGTGRMHQIRVHLAGLGNPILGDDKYGDFALNKRLRKERGLKRLLLHAFRLSLSDASQALRAPFLPLETPLPAQFDPYLAELGLPFIEPS